MPHSAKCGLVQTFLKCVDAINHKNHVYYFKNEAWPSIIFHFAFHSMFFQLPWISWHIISYHTTSAVALFMEEFQWRNGVWIAKYLKMTLFRMKERVVCLTHKVENGAQISNSLWLEFIFQKNWLQFQFSTLFTPLISSTEIMLQSEIIRPGNYTLLRD